MSEERIGLITQEDLANKVGCTKSALRIYLDGWKFSHIARHNLERQKVAYKGVTDDDIKKLRWMYFSRRRRLNYN